MAPQKTYSHLLSSKRIPSEYEIVTTKLHYYVGRGFEVEVPLKEWYRKYQENSPLKGDSWDLFADPRETTYSKYVTLQNSREGFVAGLFDSIEHSGHDRTLSEAWIHRLDRLLPPLRFPVHGFQMISSYVAHMAPGSRITIAALFQTGDEIRRIQRLAYRMRQMQIVHPDFGAEARTIWERDPAWQPLREAVERLLVTYDWGEAFVGLNLVLKPMVDHLFMSFLAEMARREGDPPLAEILFSLNEDGRWHRDWSAALVRTAISLAPGNKEVIERWMASWYPLAWKAVTALVPLFEDVSGKIPSAAPLDGVRKAYAAGCVAGGVGGPSEERFSPTPVPSVRGER